jgi:hypothetical protein
MKKVILVFLCVLLSFVMIGCIAEEKTRTNITDRGTPQEAFQGKKILYVDSYHEGYEWSDGVTGGIKSVLNGTGVELKIQRMDTKRNDTVAFGKQAALKTKSVIEEFKPDVVIISDDPAFQYLLMPYYRDASLPFVFCGINWDASIYGAPYNNTAGMIGVGPTPELIAFLKEYSKGDRLGFIAGNTTTDRKNAEYYKKLFNITFTRKYHVDTFEEWGQSYKILQDEVDILIFENKAGIKNWNDSEAHAFVLENTKIPVGAIQNYLSNDSLISLTKLPEEQGEWSAHTALLILNGTSPQDIPMVTNKKGKLYVNLKIAEKLGVNFNSNLLKNAEIIRE